MIIDRKFWDEMRHTMVGISMPLVSHQQVQQLLNHVEQMSTQPPDDPRAGHAKPNGVDTRENA